MTVVLSFTIPYNDYKIQSTFITGNFLPIGLVLVLAILALAVNTLWRLRLLGGPEVLVGMSGVGTALFALVSDQRDMIGCLQLVFALVVCVMAARAIAARWGSARDRLMALNWIGPGALLFFAFASVFPFFGILGVILETVGRREVVEVGPGFFRVSASGGLLALALALDAAVVFFCLREARRRLDARPETEPSFDPARLLVLGVYVTFALYGAMSILYGLPTWAGRGREGAEALQGIPLAPVYAFLGIVGLVALGTLVRMIAVVLERRGGAAGLSALVRLTRGRAISALVAGVVGAALLGSAWAGLILAAAAALSTEFFVRHDRARSGDEGRKVHFLWLVGAFVLVGLASALHPAAVGARPWLPILAAAGIACIGLIGRANPLVSGSLDGLAVVAAVAGLVSVAAGWSALGGVMIGGGAAFSVFSLAGSSAMVRDRALPFRRGELIVMFILMFAGGGVPASGLTRYLYPSMVAPAYYSAPENKWDERLMAYIPDFLVPFDKAVYQKPGPGVPEVSEEMRSASERVVDKFFEGYRPDELESAGQTAWEAVPWGAWVSPVVSWLVFVSLCYFMMLCLAVLLRRQWEDHERLSFPLVQVPLEMTDDPEPGRAVNKFFRNRAVWIGAAIPIIVHTVNGLATFNTKMPRFELEVNFWHLLQDKQLWSAMEPFLLEIFFMVVGLVYLLPMEVSLSMWFFWLVLEAELFFGAAFNLTLVEMPLKTYLPNYQHLGCYMAYAFFLGWTARHHIADVFQKVRGPWKLPNWGVAVMFALAPGVFGLAMLFDAELVDAAALAGVYLLAVPLGKVVAQLGARAQGEAGSAASRATLASSAGHLNGLATLVSLGLALLLGWSALVPILVALVEMRRRARSAPPVGRELAYASWIPAVLMFLGLFVPVVSSGAQGFLFAALVTYSLAVPVPWTIRAFLGREIPALASQGAAAVLIPAVLGQYVWDPGWAVAAGLCFALVGPFAGLLRMLAPGAQDVDDRREGMSYRTAVLGLVGSGIATAYIASATVGVSFGLTLAMLGIFLMVLLIFSRIVAQGGLPFIQHMFVGHDVVAATGGPRLLGLGPPATGQLDPATAGAQIDAATAAQQYPALHAGRVTQVMARWTDEFFVHDMREAVMPTAMNSFKMGGEATRNRRSILWVIVLSIALAVAISAVVRIYLSYADGGLTLEKYSMVDAPKKFFGPAVSTIQNPEEFHPHYLVGIGSGVLLTIFVLAMASRFYWWPLHPIGLLVFPSWALRHFWFSIFLGWLLKTAIWKFGSGTGVNRARPFFLGLILGDCLVGGVWIVVGLVLGQKVINIMPG